MGYEHGGGGASESGLGKGGGGHWGDGWKRGKGCPFPGPTGRRRGKKRSQTSEGRNATLTAARVDQDETPMGG